MAAWSASEPMSRPVSSSTLRIRYLSELTCTNIASAALVHDPEQSRNTRSVRTSSVP